MALNRPKRTRRKPSPDAPPRPKVERSIERQIVHNASLVEVLYGTEVWTDILEPLIDEMIASAMGRKTSGRYYHGLLSKGSMPLEYVRGYAQFGMDLVNRLQDFVQTRDNMLKQKAEENKASRQPFINPFSEEAYETRQEEF